MFGRTCPQGNTGEHFGDGSGEKAGYIRGYGLLLSDDKTGTLRFFERATSGNTALLGVDLFGSYDEPIIHPGFPLGVAGAVVDLQYNSDFLTAQQIEYEPLEDLLPLLADRPTELTDLDAYFAALR